MWLTFADLAFGYGREPVLTGLTLRLSQGLWLLSGPSGSGKSTLLRCAAGLLPPTGGRLLWNGEDAYRLAARYRWNLGYTPQETDGLPEMTVQGYLNYMAALKGIIPARRSGRVVEMLTLVGLASCAQRPAALLSGGMKRRLALAQALLNDPDLLLLDEPTTGLDPEERIRFREVLLDLSSDRIVLMATNRPAEVAEMATGRIELEGGRACFSERRT